MTYDKLEPVVETMTNTTMVLTYKSCRLGNSNAADGQYANWLLYSARPLGKHGH